MSSIPKSAMPRAVAKPKKDENLGDKAKLLLGLAVTPPVVTIALGAFAFKRLRSMASDFARKIEASGGGQATPVITIDPGEVEKGGELPVPV